MAYKQGDKVQTKRFCVTTDSNRLGYPEIAFPAGTVGTIESPNGPMPYVSRPGTFYKVNIGTHCVAIRTDNLKKLVTVTSKSFAFDLAKTLNS